MKNIILAGFMVGAIGQTLGGERDRHRRPGDLPGRGRKVGFGIY